MADRVCCPRCGCCQCTPFQETVSEGRDFEPGDALCGFLLFGPIGLLCGACNGGRKSYNRIYWICNECGHHFTR